MAELHAVQEEMHTAAFVDAKVYVLKPTPHAACVAPPLQVPPISY